MLRVSFRRRVAFVATAVALTAACSEESLRLNQTGPPPAPPLAGVDPGAVEFVSPYAFEAGQDTMPCRMHYDFAAPLDDVDCTFQAVDGTREWKMLCPAHKYLPVEDDLTFNESGVLIAETTTDAPPPIGTGATAKIGLGSLNDPPCTVLQMNDAGQPTRAHCQLADSRLPDGTPVMGDRIVTRGYDDRGRFSFQASIEAATYIVDSEVHVIYDDAAGRRDIENVFFPGHTLSIRDTRSDVFDAELRLATRTIVLSGIQTVYAYGYDDMGRVTTLSADISGDPKTQTSYSAQRSFDCH